MLRILRGLTKMTNVNRKFSLLTLRIFLGIIFFSETIVAQQSATGPYVLPEVPIERARNSPTDANLVPPQAGPPPNYKKLDHAARIMRECLSTLPSPDSNQGCVDSLRLLYDHCNQQRMAFYYYKRSNQEIFKDAEYCPLVDDSFIKLSNLFKLDEQKCIKGYETVANRIESFHKNKTMIEPEERFTYEFEKSSCKDYKRYVNLCAYVDGDLKNKPATSDEYLPQLTKFYEKKAACTPIESNNIGFANSEIDNIIYNYINKKEPDIYNSLIKDLRAKNKRSISSTTGQTVNAHCEQVRTSYLVLGCKKWENVSNDDPIYLPEDEYTKRRLKKIDESNTSN